MAEVGILFAFMPNHLPSKRFTCNEKKGAVMSHTSHPTEETMITLTLWGTRGSIPVSGPEFQRYGGATTCIELSFEDAEEDTPKRVIVDCGTGLTELGKNWSGRSYEALFLQTHMHWDHIQGFPFFGPFFHPAGRYSFWATPRSGATMRDVISRQMTQPTFPVGLDIMPSQLMFKDIPQQGEAQLGELTIRWCELCHSPGNTAYRLDYRGRSIVLSGDVEVQRGSRKELVQLAQGADLLVMDSQYFPEDYKNRVGFGHSTPLDAVAVAKEAGVLHLMLTHHDPTHTDEKLDQKLAIAQKAANGEVAVENARDQLQMSFSTKSFSSASLSSRLSLQI